MNFLPTSFFEVVREPRVLSETLGLSFDNLRTTDEIDYAVKLLQDSLNLPASSAQMILGIAVNSVWPEGAAVERDLARAAIVDDRIPTLEAEQLLDAVTRSAAEEMVVLRFEDEGSLHDLREAQATAPANSITFLNFNHPLIERAAAALELAHVIALLAVDTEDEGHLLDRFALAEHPWPSMELMERVAHAVRVRCMLGTDPDGTRGRGFQFGDFVHSWPRLRRWGQAIERWSDEATDLANVRYAGRLLELVRSTRDSRIQLTNLVAIIELLVIRKPDSNRFNVEDSITKQFVLKAGVVMNAVQLDDDLESVSRGLRDLYAIRSLISHGDFAVLEAKLQKSAFRGDEDGSDGWDPTNIRLDEAVEFALRCVRGALQATIEQPQLVTFLKGN